MASSTLFRRFPTSVRHSNGALAQRVFSARTFETTSNRNPAAASDPMTGTVNSSENISSSSTSSGTDTVNQKANYTAGTPASARAEDLTERAKQTVQDVWGAAKETVIGKAEDTKESIKQNAAKVERCMNSKD